MNKKIIGILVILVIIGAGVQQILEKNKPEVYNGRLEATTIRLSAQNTGTVTALDVSEGDTVNAGESIAFINTEKLIAQRQQIDAELSLQKDLLEKTQRLLASGAATVQRRDELAARVSVLKSQRQGLELQLTDAGVKSPISGTVLTTYVHRGEFVVPGSLIAEVADVRQLEARIYFPLTKLTGIKIGQTVKVMTDGLTKPMPGKISWIASESEFTPKTILTKETRTTLVYAVKINVPNPDGILKIGMPIDVSL
jgi:HlyD family secretion protein